jgi:hypothetical protein
MRVFRTIVQAFVLAVFDSWHDFFLCSGIAGQFVGNDDSWSILEPFEQFPEELFGGFFVASILDQDIEHIAMLIHRALQRV